MTTLYSNDFIADFKHNLSFYHRVFVTRFKQLLTNSLKLEPPYAEAYLKPCQISIVERFANIVNGSMLQKNKERARKERTQEKQE